jgi:hypothetical protein
MTDFCYRCGDCRDTTKYFEIELMIYRDGEEEYDDNKFLCEWCKDTILKMFEKEVEPNF